MGWRGESAISRRQFLDKLRWASLALAAAPLHGLFAAQAEAERLDSGATSRFEDFRLSPHYPAVSPLDTIISKVEAGHDEFLSEKYAEEIERTLLAWGDSLRQTPPRVAALERVLAPSLRATSLRPLRSTSVRSGSNLQVLRNHLSDVASLDRDAFLREVSETFRHLTQFLAAEFEVASVTVTGESPLCLQTSVRFDLLASGPGIYREGRVGYWEIEWEAGAAGEFRARQWRAAEETVSQSSSIIFRDMTGSVLAANPSYHEQMLRGTDHWRTVLDGASGIDIYGNNGVAVGDFDNDGFEDFYVCQPAGLPNRLYRNRGDGTFEDVTASAGVGVLDGTPCALFADLNNRGLQDLLVVRSTGPLLFRNQGGGKFRHQPDAFKFAHPPQGTFTSAAIADYDRDGLLDIYFCLYSYYQGLDQYQFPVPYYAAENGPPNFLFHNDGNGTFSDVTAAAGMNQNNHRFSFGCAWGDFNNDGWPDLYVANDFGKKNLYQNNANGTFTDVAEEKRVLDVGPGMSVCWFDYDNDGRQDLYVANMWTAPGLRVSMQSNFMKDAPAQVRTFFRNHAMGNALYHNQSNGEFSDQTLRAGVADGRWSWSCTSFDFDQDGYDDLYIPNGFISEPSLKDLESFFWRQVVAKSPLEDRTTREYELGWNAINELIRSDRTWSGYERNILYINNRDGTFSDVSGAVGLDFREDSRAFALADFDHDGRLEIVLKNRNAPQLRLLHNEMSDPGHSISFRLRGSKSNRDAVGAAVIVETGMGTQIKVVQVGLGFATQHTKELFFGLGKHSGPVRATIRWPSGIVQNFVDLPANHRISLEEGNGQFEAEPFHPFEPSKSEAESAVISQKEEASPFANWLLDPFLAPDFALPDLSGSVHTLGDSAGNRILLNIWATGAPACREELASFERYYSQWAEQGLKLIAVNVDGPGGAEQARRTVREMGLSFLVLLADDRWAAVYNVVYRHLYDRRRDLKIPTSLLINEQGLLVRVYQGPVDAPNLLREANSIPRTPEERIRKGLPFPGDFYGEGFHRNAFTFGVAFFQRGLRDEAINSFEHALKNAPDYAAAYYNLGTLYLQKNQAEDARKNFLRAIEIQPNYPDALNNLGLLAAQEGHTEEAIRYFQEANRLHPEHTLSLLNLGNLYRRQGRLEEAREVLERALRVKGDDPDVNYSLGMVFAQSNDMTRGQEYLQRALRFRPEFPQALNNLGIIYVMREKTPEATAEFLECIRVEPGFDQPYLNLARLYYQSNQMQKARDILRALLQQHPDHPQAKKELEAIGP